MYMPTFSACKNHYMNSPHEVAICLCFLAYHNCRLSFLCIKWCEWWHDNMMYGLEILHNNYGDIIMYTLYLYWIKIRFCRNSASCFWLGWGGGGGGIV